MGGAVVVGPFGAAAGSLGAWAGLVLGGAGAAWLSDHLIDVWLDSKAQALDVTPFERLLRGAS